MIDKIFKIKLICVLAIAVSGVVYFGSVAFTSIVPQAWASWSKHVERIETENARVAQIQEEAEERSYAVVCEDYFNASYFDKIWKVRSLKWCEDYEDKMPV